MFIVNTHTHLQYPELANRLNEVIQNAQNAGVGTIINVAVNDFEAKEFVIKNKNNFQNIRVYYTIGRHPSESNNPLSYTDIIANVGDSIALGETGIDFYHDSNPEKIKQEENFINHIEAAKKLNIPMIVHSRHGEDLTISTLKNRGVGFVLHCFTGNVDFAKQVLSLGGYISFSGIISYKKAQDIRDVVKYVPSDRFLVEGDEPFLIPHNFRKKHSFNEPAFITETISIIAQLRSTTIENVVSLTYSNSKRVFSL